MVKLTIVRFALLLALVLMAIFYIRALQLVNLPNPLDSLVPINSLGHLFKTDSCVVSEEAAEVHNGEKGFENAWIQFVNDDNTVQVQTVDTKLAILFEPKRMICFREGSIAPVTVVKCKKGKEGECDFSLLHVVYIRTELVSVLNWKYY